MSVQRRMSDYPKKRKGRIIEYENEGLNMPTKIVEMGLLPGTVFTILNQAPFGGPLYVEFGEERSRIALREEEAFFILVQDMENSSKEV